MVDDKEKRLLDNIDMTPQQEDLVWQQICKRNKKCYPSTVWKLACLLIGILLLSIPLTPLYSVAEEWWKNSWFYSSNGDKPDKKAQHGEYVTFPKNAPKQEKQYDSLQEISAVLNIPLLSSDKLHIKDVRYHPVIQKGELASVHIMAEEEHPKTQYIPKDELLETFTDTTLTAQQKAHIEDIYQMKDEDIASYYFPGVSLDISLYGAASQASGDVRAMAPGKHQIVYHSSSMNCDVIIERLQRMDGTYSTMASWVKDNALYTLIGYITIDDMKAILNTFH